MTCKDCIHYELCDDYYHLEPEDEAKAGNCSCLKDKSKFIELPCKVGDNIYTIDLDFNEKTRDFEPIIRRSKIKSVLLCKHENTYELENGNTIFDGLIGRKYFLTKAEAEETLKARNKE